MIKPKFVGPSLQVYGLATPLPPIGFLVVFRLNLNPFYSEDNSLTICVEMTIEGSLIYVNKGTNTRLKMTR